MTKIDTSTEAIAKLLDGMTEGPWTWEAESGDWPDNSLVDANGDTVMWFDFDLGFRFSTEANARFIAAASELVPALSAERDAMRAEIERLRATPPEVTALVEALREVVDAHECGVGLWRPIENAREALAKLEAEVRAEARAAAIEAAADACADYPRAAPDEREWPHYDDQISHSQDCIRAITPPADISAALDRIKADARAEGMREAARIARSVFDSMPSIRRENHEYFDGFDDATRRAEAAISQAAVATIAAGETDNKGEMK